MSKFELRLIGSYIIWYWIFFILAVVCFIVLSMIVGEEAFSGAGMSIATATAAMQPGRLYFKRMNDFPPSGLAWRMAFYFFLLQVAFEFLRMSLAIGFSGTIEFLATIFSNWLGLAAVIFMYAVVFLFTRWAFSQGAKYEEKQQAKRLQKAL